MSIINVEKYGKYIRTLELVIEGPEESEKWMHRFELCNGLQYLSLSVVVASGALCKLPHCVRFSHLKQFGIILYQWEGIGLERDDLNIDWFDMVPSTCDFGIEIECSPLLDQFSLNLLKKHPKTT